MGKIPSKRMDWNEAANARPKGSEPPVPRPAATIVLIRDSPGGLEVLLTRKSVV